MGFHGLSQPPGGLDPQSSMATAAEQTPGAPPGPRLPEPNPMAPWPLDTAGGALPPTPRPFSLLKAPWGLSGWKAAQL